jgi:hypothetical protein
MYLGMGIIRHAPVKRELAGMGYAAAYSAAWEAFKRAWASLRGTTPPANPWNIITADRINAQAYLDGYYNRKPKNSNTEAIYASLSYAAGAWDKANGKSDQFAAKKIPPPTPAQREAYARAGESRTAPGIVPDKAGIFELPLEWIADQIAKGSKGAARGLFSEGFFAGVLPILALAGVGFFAWKKWGAK